MPTNVYQRTAIAVAVAACFPAVALANAARVDFAVGNVTATGPDGKSRTLTRGAEISQGDTVNTQSGRAQLRFSDGAYMSLQPQTEFKIEQFSFAGKEDGSENIVMNLLKGGMRTITGLIGRNNRTKYQLKTEVATIGIRGTEYSVQYTNSIEVFCAGGSISMENQGGTLTISSGQGAFVSTQQTAPRQTSQPPVLSPTSTTQQKQQEEQQQASSEPTNPTQEQTGGTQETLTEQVQQILATPPAPTPKLTGDFVGNWAVAYPEGNFNLQLGQQISIDSGGALLSFVDMFETSGTNTRGSSSATLAGNDGVLAWGRWVNGMVGGNGAFSGLDTTFNPLHWVVGLPATNMPTSGTATYNMIGSSASCLGSCTGISLPNGTLNQVMVNFGTNVVGMNLTIDLTGGLVGRYQGTKQESFGLNPSNGQFFVFSIPTSGPGGSGFFTSGGFLAGSGASHAGAAFGGSLSGSGGFATIEGVGAYKK